MNDNKVPASTTEYYSMLRTLEETKNPSSIRIYLEAKTGITLIFARVCIFTKERYRNWESTVSVLLLRQSNLVSLNVIGQLPWKV